MPRTVKYVANVYDEDNKTIVSTHELFDKAIDFPETIDDFGLRHGEQIALVKASQDVFLGEQSTLFTERTECPECGEKPKKSGKFTSDFHDVFTDHEVSLQRHTCRCGWKSVISIDALYGDSRHPELLKSQIEIGTDISYRQAGEVLNRKSAEERSINNHTSLRKGIALIGTTLSDVKSSPSWIEQPHPETRNLTVVIDGGHIQDAAEGKHSFEELICSVNDPKALVTLPDGRREIIEKICVGSARSDSQKTIKAQLLNACTKLGMTSDTRLTILTDGAANCWSAAEHLRGYCNEFETVLDWYHITQKFTSGKTFFPEELLERYQNAKWHLWHGKASSALIRLQEIKNKLGDNEKAIGHIDKLIDYITNNRPHIPNYFARRLAKKNVSSQLAESTVNAVINKRQKNQQMSWSREGAHNVIQIRASRFSSNWDEDWKLVKNKIYKKAA